MAREHRIGVVTVSQLVNKAKKKQKFIQDIVAERDRKLDRQKKIIAAVESMMVEHEVIDSAAQVCEHL